MIYRSKPGQLYQWPNGNADRFPAGAFDAWTGDVVTRSNPSHPTNDHQPDRFFSFHAGEYYVDKCGRG